MHFSFVFGFIVMIKKNKPKFGSFPVRLGNNLMMVFEIR